MITKNSKGLLVGILCLWLTAPGMAQSKKGALPSWSPNPRMLRRLSSPVKLSFGQIRPPKGYEFRHKTQTDGGQDYAWLGASNEDATRPYLMVLTLIPPAGDKNHYTLAQMLNKSVQNLRQRRDEWKQGPTETGRINGAIFARVWWSAHDVKRDAPEHGFIYVTQQGNHFLQLSSLGTEPYHVDALALAQASALTIKTK